MPNMWDRVNKINDTYLKSGFHGVIEYVKESLYFAMYLDIVEEIEDGLWKIQHTGVEEDDLLIHSLISSHSLFRKHYVGYICGGEYYFVENTNDNVGMKILHEKENKEENCGYICLECGKDMVDDRRAYCSDCEPLQNMGHSKDITSDGRIFYDDPKAADRHQRRVWNEKDKEREDSI